jgi:hypothetical protein
MVSVSTLQFCVEQRPNISYNTLVVTRNPESGESGGLWRKDKLRYCEAELNSNLADGLVRYFDFLGTVFLSFYDVDQEDSSRIDTTPCAIVSEFLRDRYTYTPFCFTV